MRQQHKALERFAKTVSIIQDALQQYPSRHPLALNPPQNPPETLTNPPPLAQELQQELATARPSKLVVSGTPDRFR